MAASLIATSALDALLLHEGKRQETVKIVSIPLGAIVMPGFQRERIQSHITKLGAEWDDTAYAFPMVAEFRGNFIAIDGQQRLAAAESLGKKKVDVLLIEGVRSIERLAELFLRMNRDRKLLNAFQKHVAALEAKDRGTVEIARVLDSFGLEASKSAAINGKVPIGAVTAIHDKGGSDLLARVLKARTQAWGDTPSREANEGRTLLGIALFLGRYWDQVDDGRLIGMLRRHHPGYLLESTDQKRGSFRAAYSDHLRDLYNKGLRGKGRL